MPSSVTAKFHVVPTQAGTSGVFSTFLKQVQALGGLTALMLLLTGCARPQPNLPAGTTALNPIAFFAGPTSGEGTLKTIIGTRIPIRVESFGTRTPTGLRLVQRITEGRKPPRIRVWTIDDYGDGLYPGTLTDATKRVFMAAVGPRAYIAYSTQGERITQQLALQPDGTIRNRLLVNKWGFRVATLDETIRKPVAK